jgi:hypothetical protein
MSISIWQIKLGLICSIVGAVLFGLICAIFHVNDFQHVTFAAGVGAFSGLVGAPEFDPESYKDPKWFQTISGSLSGLLFALLLKWGVVGIIVSAFIGSSLGYTAKYWVNHVQIP